MELTKNAVKVLEKRYLQPGETPKLMFRRVADHVASAEFDDTRDHYAEKFYSIIERLEFLPNSPVLRNFGANDGCGSACFVLPISDDLSDIYDTLRKASLVQKFGGGTGFSFSRLRPKGAEIKKTGGHSSGPLSFAQVYDFSLGEVIKQGGTRHGANMGILRVDHPDIRDFITAKAEEGVLCNFNTSIGITDEFMGAVKGSRRYDLMFNGTGYESVPAKEIFDLMIDCAHKSGEPGVVFLDTINRKNTLNGIADIEATNPCGEQPLLPYGSCTLGSINLSTMTIGDWTKAPATLDIIKLESVAKIAARFLDNVITKNNYPIPEIAEMALKTRQIGIGVMGFADLCIKMHIRYGSPESEELAKTVMSTIFEAAKTASEELAIEKGSFPAIDEIIWRDKHRRNALLTSCAPTGTLSLIANCSGGIEPHFAFNYRKNCLDGESLSVVPQVVKEYIAVHGDLAPLPNYFIEAGQVTPEEHLKIQAAFQNNGVDSGVSKTINMPNSATREDIANAFMMAWDLGCKGVTVYRDGSRQRQALESRKAVKAEIVEIASEETLRRGDLKERPRSTTGPTLRMKTACGKLYVSPTFDKDGLLEAFIRTEQGGCEANTKAMGVLLSYFLRSGGSPHKLKSALETIKCPACMRGIEKGKDIEVQSCPAGLATALAIAVNNTEQFKAAAEALSDADAFFLKNGKRASSMSMAPKLGKCPDCGQYSLAPDSGCVVCTEPGCGYSKC